MVPGVDTRLSSLTRAIEQVILPAIPEGEKLAREQAEIAIGHLRVLGAQWRYILPMARRELALIVDLVAALAGHADDPHKAAFRSALADAGRRAGDDLQRIDDASLRLGTLVETWLGTAPELLDQPAVKQLVQSHARAQSRHERVWFAASGIVDTTGLPSIEDYLAEVREPAP